MAHTANIGQAHSFNLYDMQRMAVIGNIKLEFFVRTFLLKMPPICIIQNKMRYDKYPKQISRITVTVRVLL